MKYKITRPKFELIIEAENETEAIDQFDFEFDNWTREGELDELIIKEV
jgi:hypothetical protein